MFWTLWDFDIHDGFRGEEWKFLVQVRADDLGVNYETIGHII